MNFLGRCGLAAALAASLFALPGCAAARDFSRFRESFIPEDRFEKVYKLAEEGAEKNGLPDKYAVLVCGSEEEKYRENVSMAYSTLLSMGFIRDNIFILDYRGERWFDPDKYPVLGPATRESVRRVFDYLRNRIDNKDTLYVLTTGHGERMDDASGDKVSTFSIPGPDILQNEMAEMVQGIGSRLSVLLFNHCYAGGFAEAAAGGNAVAISSCSADEVGVSYKFDSIPWHFMNAWWDRSADTDSDGVVTVTEAFNYAVSRHTPTKKGAQTPLLLGSPDGMRTPLGK